MRRTTKKGSSGLALVVPAATVIISLLLLERWLRVDCAGRDVSWRLLSAPALPEVQANAVRKVLPEASASRVGLLGSAKTVLIRDGQPKSKRRSLIGGLTFFVGIVTLSLLATGGSYALWNTAAAANTGSLKTGNIGLTINSGSSYTLGLSTANLAPGHSTFAAATLANTGTVPLSVYVASTTLNSNTNGVAGSLTAVVTPVTATGNCAAGLTGGTSALLGSYNNSSAPYSIAVGASKVICVEIVLGTTAPTTVEGGSSGFTMNVVAKQVHS